MAVKNYKREQGGKLEIGRELYTKRFALTVDRARCKGCQLCKLVCPKDAISRRPQEDLDGKARPPLVDIDPAKCDFEGICSASCPFAAITITVDGSETLPAVEYDAFPTLTRDITVDAANCEDGCTLCEEKCPLGLIKVDPEAKTVDIQKECCSGCQTCWAECPEEVISVEKFIEGSIDIDTSRCPEGCKRCADVCPVHAIEYEDGEVFANDYHCIYCGTCMEVCPEEGAIKVERTAIRHSKIESGAWNKGLEKLTSAAGLQRELAAESAAKALAEHQTREVEA